MALLSQYGTSYDLPILNPMQNSTGNPMVVPITSLEGFIAEFEGDFGRKTA